MLQKPRDRAASRGPDQSLPKPPIAPDASHSDQASTILLRLPLVVAMVAQRHRLSLVPARPAEVEAAVTLRPRAPC